MRHASLVAAGAILATACGTSTGPESDNFPLLNRDVATVAADATAEDVDLMGDPGILVFSLGASFAASPGGDFGRARDCPFTDGRFQCPPITMGPLTLIRSFAFFDANATPQTAYDEALTASANFQTSLTGEVSREAWSGAISRSRDFTASGLLGQETQRTWNGTGEGSVTRSRHTDGGEVRTYDMTYTTTVANVVVPFPHAPGGWPLSGTITHHVTVTITGGTHDGATRERTAVITFNGTQFVPVTVNGETFEVDLANRRLGHH